MDAFYRQVRRRTGILMEEGKPVAGKFSFDADNREPWSGEPWPPEPPKFTPDDITIEVAELIENRFADHPGELNLSALPATAADAATVWRWARDECMEYFGPFEDAMSRKSEGLFHTRISSLLNIHRLLPARVVEDVAAMEIPLASKEGFIRQVLGWREFVRHVHERTDGFRRVNGNEGAVADSPGDAGWGRWRGQSWQGSITPSVDGGADPSSLGGRRQLPLGFWPGRPTGLACLDRVVGEVWSNAWTHHIPRLMVLGNIAALLDVSPRQLTDWFWVAFVDAFDWVVEPNVLAMGSYGVGPVMTTKPYVSGAAYINRMSDYCGECEFDPKTTCPITNLYWAFLHRHRDRLRDNPRMRLIMSTAAKRAPEQRVLDEAVFKWMVSVLDRGEYLKPEDRPEV
jgi:deoxyribodipyrimidine photolyase-related protein